MKTTLTLTVAEIDIAIIQYLERNGWKTDHLLADRNPKYIIHPACPDDGPKRPGKSASLGGCTVEVKEREGN